MGWLHCYGVEMVDRHEDGAGLTRPVKCEKCDSAMDREMKFPARPGFEKVRYVCPKCDAIRLILTDTRFVGRAGE